MTVVFNNNDQRFKASDVLWAKQELINAIIEQALISQTEAFIDMIVDGQEDLTREGIQDTLKGVKESTAEFLKDVVADLQHSIEQRLTEANYGAIVTGIKYDLAGEIKDVEVDVSVS